MSNPIKLPPRYIVHHRRLTFKEQWGYSLAQIVLGGFGIAIGLVVFSWLLALIGWGLVQP